MTDLPAGKRGAAIALLLVVLATAAAYANTFGVPFLLDDRSAITSNPSICHLSHWACVLWPSETATTAGRPLLNLSFALNYAVGRFQLTGYHLLNIALHLAAGLTLFEIVRRTLMRMARVGRGACAGPLFRTPVHVAAAIAALWLLHPVQTEAVTYLSQRAESLMGLCALLTLYCFIRAVETEGRTGIRPAVAAMAPASSPTGPVGGPRSPETAVSRRAWYAASVAACAAGMAAKEVMVTVPAVVLLYDRAFVSDSLRRALANRRWYYAGLALTWGLLAALMTGARVLAHPSVGFHTPTPLAVYWAIEAMALVLYAKLTLWPHPLVFDYGPDVVPHGWTVLTAAAAITIAATGCVLLWRRCRPAAFLLTTYFLLLAPTSLVPVAFDPIAESRVYLPSAALVTLMVVGVLTLAGRRALPVLGVVALTFAGVTWQRNRDYASARGLWAQTCLEQPGSSRAHYSLGYELARDPARRAAALAELATALRIRPDYPEALSRRADLLATMPGREADAITAYRHALRVQPDYVVARNNLANVLARLPGRESEALAQYRVALNFDPEYRQAHYNLANLLARTPVRWPEAIAQYQRAIALDPAYALARNNLGLVYAAEGRMAEAVEQWRLALQADPACVVARANLRRWTAAAPRGANPRQPNRSHPADR